MKWKRSFSLLLLGQSLANIGDVLYIVSIISIIFTLKGSAIAASFVPFTIASSMFISSLLTPLLVEKLNLKWLLAGSQILKTLLLFMLGFLLPGLTLVNYYLIFVLIGLIALLDGCANPIRQTLTPYYVKSEHLIQANGIAETITQVIQAGMWFLGSSLLIIMTPQQLIWLVGCLFVVSSIILCLIEGVSHVTTEVQGKLEMIKEGWKTLSNTPVLRRIAWIEFLETIAATVWIAAILYVFVNEALNVDEKWWGFINGANFLGLILGSAYCIKYSSFVEKKLGLLFFIGPFASFLFTLSFSLNSIPVIALVLSFGVGLFGQIKRIPQQTIIQTSVSKGKLSSVYTSLGAIGTGIFGIGSLIMGGLGDLLGIRTVFVISGLLLAIVSSITYRNKHLFVRNTIE